MPWRAPWGARGPGLPRGVTLEENSPTFTPTLEAGRSTSTQWKKSTRGRDAGTRRPSWFTSSPLLGTSGSWQTMAKDLVPMGTSVQARCGFWFFESVACVFGSMAQKAYSEGMTPPSSKLELVSFMSLRLVDDVGDLDLEDQGRVRRDAPVGEFARAVGLVRRDD